MTNLDSISISLFLSILNLFGAAAYFYTHFTNLRMRGLGLWGLGHLALSATFFVFWARENLTELPLFVPLITFPLLTCVAWWLSSRYFFGKQRPHLVPLLLPAVAIASLIIGLRIAVVLQWSEAGEFFKLGARLFFLVGAYYLVAIAHEFLTYRSSSTNTARAIGSAFALLALAFLVRIIMVPDAPEQQLAGDNIVQLVIIILVMFVQVFALVGLVLISAERLQMRLNRQAQTDPLTGMLNRRGFEVHAEREMKRWRRSNTHLAVMVFDLDRFKSVNDSYGHSVGDEVLKVFSNCMVQHFRATDLIARFGGEEFVALCPDIELADALVLANRIRELMAGKSIEANDTSFSVTVSIGLEVADSKDLNLDALIQQADTALYQAKAKGRNHVVTNSTSPSSEDKLRVN